MRHPVHIVGTNHGMEIILIAHILLHHFFGRGGYYSRSSYAGVFAFYYYSGAANTYGGFRPVLVV